MGKKCAKCDEEFKPGESQLTAMGKTWHKGCFVCAKCGKPFSAGSIVVEDGKPVHEECDGAKESSGGGSGGKKGKKGVCSGCKQDFKPGESILTAMDKPWHQGCFKCAKCKKPFTGGSIVLEKGKPMHEDCSKEQFDDDNGACDVCGESLGNGEPIIQLSDQSQYHQGCFKCTVCDKPFDKKNPYHVKVNGKPCHTKCADVHDDVTEKVIKNDKGCTKCGKEIDGPVKVVPNVGSYHPECFVCDTCGCELSGRYSIHPKTEKPNCKDCVQKFTAKWDRNKEARAEKVNSMECTKCGKMIDSNPKKVPDIGNFHRECFVCDTCGCELKKKYFIHPKTKMPNCKPCLDEYVKEYNDKKKEETFWKSDTRTVEISQPFEIKRTNNDCIKCGKATDPETAKKVPDVGSWHPECFSCDTCGCSINRKYGLHPETNLPNCKPCMEKYG